ncbi:hypothetical protein CLV80_11919 [Yoonia maritima]|uniref:Uncharacterized protein n=1 Tax=Yoonia maritima TaxID=1435347 RepID=A0A2T0VTB3_9RHOB|nr:DUF6525 family protein [Yoonia maritima]PRY74346.1 hypothetical protein CLV80_11919 [Yoonia maritima]
MGHLNRQDNMRSALKRRARKGDPMAAYDQLPSALRSWLMHATLPWSASSAHRIWRNSLRASGGDLDAARQRLTQIEQATLKRDRFST